jgi:hypothetical protein
MPIEAKNITPARRSQFLDLLQSLGGQPAVTDGLEVLARLDAGQALVGVPPKQQGIGLQVPPDLLANVPAGALAFGIPTSDLWKWVLKLQATGVRTEEHCTGTSEEMGRIRYSGSYVRSRHLRSFNRSQYSA